MQTTALAPGKLEVLAERPLLTMGSGQGWQRSIPFVLGSTNPNLSAPLVLCSGNLGLESAWRGKHRMDTGWAWDDTG